MSKARSASADAPPPSRRWLFGAATLEERTLELRVASEAVAIERKPLELLLFLLQHAGELVTKSEIVEAVWPGRILTDSVLTKAMSKLREALQDDAQMLIRTQHGHGYRLMADVRVEWLDAPMPARPGFEPGDRLGQRPLWSLVERLGLGGHGEVWLAQHDKTREQRVFKIARDTTALGSLKREITLYRVLHDSLGDDAAVVPILDWNLAEPPYFLEAAHCGTNLVEWAGARGGLAQLPLSMRLEIAAQIAEALARAHSVGVLHKDLKPANVLVEDVEGAPRIRLSDFGSGGVLDLQQLERLGITRLGLTQGVDGDGATATPSYLAPEVVAGQPFTVKADLYALGVILYELLAGSFRRPFAPGWELDVGDELLREDIASACAGNPAQRLPEASMLARRLRSLEARRQARREAQAQRQRVERAERARQELKRLRIVAATLLALTLTSLLAVVYAHRSRQQAITAAETTQAVTDFLVKDVLAGTNPYHRPSRDLTLREVLKRAAVRVDPTLAGQPEAARQVHLALSSALSAVWDKEAALHHARRHEALSAQTQGIGSEQHLGALNWVKHQLIYLGRLDEFCAVAAGMQPLMQGRADHGHPLRDVVRRVDALSCRFVAGDSAGFDAEATALMREIEARRPATTEAIWQAHPFFARYYWWGLGDLGKAIGIHRRLVELASAEFGQKHLITSLFREELASALSGFGEFEAAEQALDRAESDIKTWLGESGEAGAEPARFTLPFRAMLRLNQGRFAEAGELALANREQVLVTEWRTSDVEWMSAWLLAETQQLNGRCDAALEVTSSALAPRPAQGSHWYSYSLSMPLYQVAADCLREKGDLEAARAVLAQIPQQVIDRYPPGSPFLAFFLRARGLLHAASGQDEAARRDLARVLAILEPLDPQRRSWRVARSREELARLSRCAIASLGDSA